MSYNAIAENLVIRICASFNEDLKEDDFLKENDTDPMDLLADKDKEYTYKSKILAVTQEGITKGRSCPVHVNEGLIPTMMTIRKTYHIGKGNVGFGSAIVSKTADINERIADRIYEVGGRVQIAQSFSKEEIGILCSKHIIPTLIENFDELKLDDYVLIKDVKAGLENRSQVTFYRVDQNEGIMQINMRFAELSESEIDTLLN